MYKTKIVVVSKQ